MLPTNAMIGQNLWIGLTQNFTSCWYFFFCTNICSSILEVIHWQWHQRMLPDAGQVRACQSLLQVVDSECSFSDTRYSRCLPLRLVCRVADTRCFNFTDKWQCVFISFTFSVVLSMRGCRFVGLVAIFSIAYCYVLPIWRNKSHNPVIGIAR